MQKKPIWTTTGDVLASLDEVSVFTKGQSNIAKTKILTETHLEKMKKREREQLEAELAKNERERLQQDEERKREDQRLEEDEWEQRKQLILPGGRGRAQLIMCRKRKVHRNSTQENERYITERVRQTAGYYGNDRIESYWGSLQSNEESQSSSGEESTTPVTDDQFDDVETSSSDVCSNTESNGVGQPMVADVTQPVIKPEQYSSKPRGHRNALMAMLVENMKKNEPDANDETEVDYTAPNQTFGRSATNGASEELSDVEQHQASVVYGSSQRQICPSKYTFPSAYDERSSFMSQWNAKNRIFKPSAHSKDLYVHEFVYKKEDFPPL